MPGPSPRRQKMDKYLDRVSHGRTHKKGLVICWLWKRLFADDTALLLVQIQSQSQSRAASMPRWMDGRTMASLHKRFMPHAYFPFDFLFCFGWVHNWILKHSPTTDCGPGEPPRTVRECGCGCGKGNGEAMLLVFQFPKAGFSAYFGRGWNRMVCGTIFNTLGEKHVFMLSTNGNIAGGGWLVADGRRREGSTKSFSCTTNKCIDST